MDTFIRLYNIYQSSTRWSIVKQIYKQSSTLRKIILWALKIASVLFFLATMFIESSIFFWLLTVTLIVYFLTFYYTRTASFSYLSRRYPERVKFFLRNFQYIRYEEFKEGCESANLVGNIDEALRFVNYELDYAKPTHVSSQPIFATQIAVILAIVGGAAGQWNPQLTVKIISLLILFAYVTFLVLDALKDSQPGMSEFKKFLLWAKEDLTFK